jgi:hypothetical protein
MAAGGEKNTAASASRLSVIYSIFYIYMYKDFICDPDHVFFCFSSSNIYGDFSSSAAEALLTIRLFFFLSLSPLLALNYEYSVIISYT